MPKFEEHILQGSDSATPWPAILESWRMSSNWRDNYEIWEPRTQCRCAPQNEDSSTHWSPKTENHLGWWFIGVAFLTKDSDIYVLHVEEIAFQQCQRSQIEIHRRARVMVESASMERWCRKTKIKVPMHPQLAPRISVQQFHLKLIGIVADSAKGLCVGFKNFTMYLFKICCYLGLYFI